MRLARRAQKFAERDRAARLQLAQQQTSDQKARQHEEDVDTDEATVDAEQPGVEQHDDDHGDARKPSTSGRKSSVTWSRRAARTRW